MSRLALVAPDDTIHEFKPADKVDLTAGTKAGYRWLPVVTVDVDTSTGANTTTERTGPVVEATQVTFTRTTRDMDASETDVRKSDIMARLYDDPAFKALIDTIRIDVLNALKSGPNVSPADFRQMIRRKLP